MRLLLSFLLAVSVFAAICVVVYLVVNTPAPVTAAPVSPVTEPVVLHNTTCHTIERFTDREAGVVCWVDLTCQGVGISCIPMNQLPVWSKAKE